MAIVYPGAVWGPHDPHFGESCQVARNILRRRYPLLPRGSLPISDVRETAELHVALLESGRGPRRYFVPSQDATLGELTGLIGELTGRRLWAPSVPAALVLGPTRAAGRLLRGAAARLPVVAEEVQAVRYAHSLDATSATDTFGSRPRPLRDTVADTLRWLHETGYVSAKAVGILARPMSASE